jgi:hypothetical protein
MERAKSVRAYCCDRECPELGTRRFCCDSDRRNAFLQSLGFDDRLKRMWEYYLAYCQVGVGAVDVGFYRFGSHR